jgi:tetratricopeptide (TPR) repeat protein
MRGRARIRCLAAAVIASGAVGAIAAQLPAAAQTPAVGAADLYARALELEQRGNNAAALSLLWEAAGLAPHDGPIQNHLGEALEKIGALDAAVEAYRAAADAHPPPRGAPNNLVLALVKSGRSAEGIARARASAAEAPRDPERWFTLGMAQADVDVEGAVDSFHRALALERRHALARYNLALVHYHADRLQPALDELHAALAIQPKPEIHYTTGIIYWHQGELDRAVKALDEAVAANPAYADAHLALGTVLKARGDLKRAVSALTRAIELRPDVPAPHIVLAQTLALANDEAGARRETAEADRLRTRAQQSQEAATWTAVGAQTLDAGDAAAAAEYFRRATQAFDGFAPAHYQLGRALQRLGQHDAARAAFARAQQLNPALVPPR